MYLQSLFSHSLTSDALFTNPAFTRDKKKTQYDTYDVFYLYTTFHHKAERSMSTSGPGGSVHHTVASGLYIRKMNGSTFAHIVRLFICALACRSEWGRSVLD